MMSDNALRYIQPPALSHRRLDRVLLQVILNDLRILESMFHNHVLSTSVLPVAEPKTSFVLLMQ